VDDIPQLETTWTVQADEVAALKPDLVIAGIPYCAGRMLRRGGVEVQGHSTFLGVCTDFLRGFYTSSPKMRSVPRELTSRRTKFFDSKFLYKPI
jgi:hypothetical protein